MTSSVATYSSSLNPGYIAVVVVVLNFTICKSLNGSCLHSFSLVLSLLAFSFLAFSLLAFGLLVFSLLAFSLLAFSLFRLFHLYLVSLLPIV